MNVFTDSLDEGCVFKVGSMLDTMQKKVLSNPKADYCTTLWCTEKQLVSVERIRHEATVTRSSKKLKCKSCSLMHPAHLYMLVKPCPTLAFHRSPRRRWWCPRPLWCSHGDSCRRPGSPVYSHNQSDWHSWCYRGQNRPPLVSLWRTERVFG